VAVAQSPTQAQSNQPRPNFAKFLAMTTPIWKQLSDVSSTNPGDQKTIDLDRVGYLAYATVIVQGTITTGVGATGTWDANYWPGNLLSKIRAESNTGYVHYNTSGFENLLVQQSTRIGFSPGVRISPLSAYGGVQGARNVFGTLLNATTNTIVAPGTAVAASTTYKVFQVYLVPFVSHSDLRTGLIMVQNNATRVTLFLTVGSVIDWLGATGSLGTAGSISLTMRTTENMFTIPSDPTAQPYAPGEGFRHRIISDRQSWTTSGDIDYRVPVNGIIARAWIQFRSASGAGSILVPQPLFTAAGAVADPTLPLFNNITVQYASSQQPESWRFEALAFWIRQMFLTDMPDGTILYDFATGSTPEAGIAIEGLYNTRRVTEFLLRTNTTVVPPVNSVIDCMRQELQPAA